MVAVFIGILFIILGVVYFFSDDIVSTLNKIKENREEKKLRKEANEERIKSLKESMAKLFEASPKEEEKETYIIRESDIELTEEADSLTEIELREQEEVRDILGNRWRRINERKENLRGPLPYGNVYYDPANDNLVSPRWMGAHSIYKDEDDNDGTTSTRYY